MARIRIKPELFDRLKARATERKVRFSSVVNDVIECGLFDLEEQERDEPIKLSVAGRG